MRFRKFERYSRGVDPRALIGPKSGMLPFYSEVSTACEIVYGCEIAAMAFVGILEWVVSVLASYKRLRVPWVALGMPTIASEVYIEPASTEL